MTLAPRPRKFARTAQVTSSVGWLGAVAGFFALAVAGLTSKNARLVRGAYLAMEVTGWFVLVSLSLASLLTGLVQSLGAPRGLFRHYCGPSGTCLSVEGTPPTPSPWTSERHRPLSSADMTLPVGQLGVDATGPHSPAPSPVKP